MENRITVIIPNYNGARFLPHLFESLISQTYSKFLCYFVDDGSTDASLHIARKYLASLPSLEIYECSNIGLSKNWNRCVEMVSTEYFTLLHCDDAYEPAYLETMLALMDQFPDAAIGHCPARTISVNSRSFFSPIESYKKAKYFQAEYFCHSVKDEYVRLMEGDYINCPSVVYRSKSAESVGRFNECLSQTLDWEYWFRILQANFKICATRKSLFRYRRHNTNATIVNSRAMRRYQEEISVLTWAYDIGINSGYLAEPLNKQIVNNIIIFDVASTLSSGDKDAARGKISYMKSNLSVSTYMLTFLSVMVRLGRVGGMLLRSLIIGWIFMLLIQQSLRNFYPRDQVV